MVDRPLHPRQPLSVCVRRWRRWKSAAPKCCWCACFGLSLSDQYWICPEGSNLTWDSINFFENDFSEDIGDILFGENKKKDALDFSSPDNTSDGNLKKRWKIIDGKRCLIKGGSNPFRQQPFNEVIAAGLMERLDIPHVPYTVVWNKGRAVQRVRGFRHRKTPSWFRHGASLKTQEEGQQRLGLSALCKLLRGARVSRALCRFLTG